MKTKIKVVLKDGNQPRANTTFTITPVKKNHYSSGNLQGNSLQGTTDDKGECIVALEPAWYPYRLSVSNVADSIYFLVVKSEETIPLEELKIDHLNYDPFSPLGETIRKLIEAQVKQFELLKKIEEERRKLEAWLAGQSQPGEIDTSGLKRLIEQFAALVQANIDSKILLLDAIRELKEQHTSLMQTHADMALIARDYLIAKEMGAINLNGHYLWFDDNDKLRWKKGVPSNEHDGTPIN